MNILQKLFEELKAQGHTPQWIQNGGYSTIAVKGALVSMGRETSAHSDIIFDRNVVIHVGKISPVQHPTRSKVTYTFDRKWSCEVRNIHPSDQPIMDLLMGVMKDTFGVAP